MTKEYFKSQLQIEIEEKIKIEESKSEKLQDKKLLKTLYSQKEIADKISIAFQDSDTSKYLKYF
jgi:hypothetical protein